MTKLLTINGSPVPNSSTEILTRTVAEEFISVSETGSVEHRHFDLHGLDFIACKACGVAPTEKWCFYDDDLTPVFDALAAADCMVFGSPIYFDSVSAQAKAFIDRCNCFRPADFKGEDPDHNFLKRLTRKRPGAMVLVGGEQTWFEGARRCIAGYFKWIEVVNEGVVTYATPDYNRIGSVRSDEATLNEARELGRKLAKLTEQPYEAR